MRHLEPKNLVKFLVKADPINGLDLLPFLQGDNKIEAFLDSNTANAENRSHVDDPDPTDLDVIASQFWRRRHKLATFERSDSRHVIGYEAVATLDQAKNAFTFADAARAA